MNTIATLDGSTRTIELGTLEAIELCRDIAKQNDHDVKELDAKFNSVIEAYWLSQSDDEQTALDARKNLGWLMYEPSNAMYELGYYAAWHGGWLYIERVEV